jgi:hypothetical protein
MITRDRLPKPALDWGLNDSLAGILNTFLNILSNLLDPISQLIQAIVSLFTGEPEA